jgi:primosomal replication protein N''
MTLVKVCPRCKFENDPAESYCRRIKDDGDECNHSIALTLATLAGGMSPISAAVYVGEQQAISRRCENGHQLDDSDLVCIECGAAPAADENHEPVVATESNLFNQSYRILHRLDVVSSEADLYVCQPIPTQAIDYSELLIKHYRPGFRPSGEVLDKLRSIKSRHCLVPFEVGEAGGRPFEAYEYLRGGTLIDVPKETSRQHEFAWALVQQMVSAMQNLQECQLLHRDLKPANILLRSLNPPEFVLSDFGASAVSECDVHVTTTRLTTRYAAPETYAGVMSSASDWWSIGLILLELLSDEQPLQGVDDRAFILSIIARPIVIPEQICDRWKMLLKGLLTRDHTVRWGLDQVRAWLNGDESLSHGFEDHVETQQSGTSIRLGGQAFYSAERYALGAAHSANWFEAVSQLASGELGTWLVEDKLDAQSLEIWNQISRDTSLEDELRLMLALLVLNAQLPLCYRGEVLSQITFSSSAQRSLSWLDTTIPEHLSKLRRELWLVELAGRRRELKSWVENHRLNLDISRLEALSLVPDQSVLQRQWLARQAEFPEPRHPVLMRLASRQTHSDTELIVLLSAKLDEFRSADQILDEAREEAARAGLADLFDSAKSRKRVQAGRSAVLRALNMLLADFVRCERLLADEWADTFRFDHRITLSRALVLLGIPAEQWMRPEGGQQWYRLMDYFRRKVLASVQRGPLMSLRISASAARIDLAELGSDVLSAESLLDSVLDGSGPQCIVDPNLMASSATLQRRIRRLRNNTDSYLRDTGIPSLFLGFPFLIRRDRSAGQTTPRFIPLFLWPITLEYPDGQGTRLRIRADRDQDRVRLNPALAIALDVSVRGKLESCLTDLQNLSNLTAAQVLELVKQAFSSQSIEVAGEFTSLPSEPRLRETVDCRVISSGVLFQCDFAGQELAEELDRLQKLPFVNSPAATLMRLSPAGQETDENQIPTAENRFLVTDADPSQEAAVYAARKQPGLLIQGPPGTGKSQTIVNIVADAIAREKTVLVVCQKQAALDVVGHRLQAVGLGSRIAMIGDPVKDRRPFLKSLRDQLENPGSADRKVAAANLLSKANEVNALERQIDSVHDAMTNVVGNSGLTYEAVIAELIGVENASRYLSLPAIRSTFVELHAGEVRALSGQLEHYGALWLAARFENNPLHCLKPFSPDVESIDALKQHLDVFVGHERRRMDEIDSRKLTVDIDRLEIPAIDRWLSVHDAAIAESSESLLKAMKLWVDLFENGVAPAVLGRLQSLGNVAESNLTPEYEVRLRNKLSSLSDKQIQDLFRDSKTVVRWRRSWLRSFWPAFRNALRRLLVAFDLDRPSAQNEIEKIVAALKYECVARACCRDYERCRADLKLQFQAVNMPSSQLVLKIRSLVSSLDSAKALIERGESCPERNAFFKTLKTGEPQKLLALLGAFRQGVVLYGLRSASFESLEALSTWIKPSQLDALRSAIRRGHSSTDWSSAVNSAWATVFEFQRFRLRFASLKERERLILTALSKKRDELERVPVSEVGTLIRNTAWREALLGWKDRAEREWPSLLIDRSEFDKKLEALRKSSKELNRLVLELAPKLPRPGEIKRRAQWDDIVMLQGPRAKKLRETVGMGKELGLYQLRPVWLASPLTVSRIFPLQQGLFDVVIFDEASQLPVEYSLPAIYRGKTIIVSGDDKQLPPSKFFTAAFSDDTAQVEDESQDETDERFNQVEVKDCTDLLELASPVFPKVMLNIHYRSRFRQLIDFANSAFYEGRLSVPVLHPLERISEFKPIQFVEVNGVYSEQTNEQEAEKVVEALRGFWASTPFERVPTIGVVTFNMKQAELIEEKLETLAEKDSNFCISLQAQRDRNKDGEHCGFFVKNVENVQGDERDCMIFSTTFGKNPRNEFKRFFGVLGQSGGERRLNVATTRSKTRMIIFSSMPLDRISDIHRSTSPPQTPRDHLQAYLMYAKAVSDKRYTDANRILASFGYGKEIVSSDDRQNSVFVTEVQSFLEQEGWKVERPWSNDAFQFDLAIRREGAFAIAINCDSPRHAQLRFARHREIWRTEVLRSSVKRIHRVWSREWLTDNEKEKRRLSEAVSDAMKG